MNRRFFLQFVSLLLPVTKLFGWKQEAPQQTDIGQILTAIEKETQSWIGLSERQLFVKYELPLEHVGEWGFIRSIQPLRDAVAKKFGLPKDHILFFGVQFKSTPSSPFHPQYLPTEDRKLRSVYNIEIFKPIQGVKEFPGRKGHWIQAT